MRVWITTEFKGIDDARRFFYLKKEAVMAKFNQIMLLSALVLLLSAYSIRAQGVETTIEDIKKNEGPYIGLVVVVEGTVEEWVEAEVGKHYYILKGDYGGIIEVNSESKPDTHKRYRVKGSVQSKLTQNVAIIAEISRVSLESTPPTIPPEESKGFDQRWLILIFAVLVVALILLFVFLQRAKKQPPVAETPATRPSMAPPSIAGPDTVPASYGQFSTIKISQSPMKTLRFIPGKLEITSGEDAGKSFPIAGYPTDKGCMVSIGRESVKGDRVHSHIKLDDKFRTVSRKQAEIRERGGKVFLKNIGEVNPTQVNGRQLEAGEECELASGDSIKMGELEFKYTV